MAAAICCGLLFCAAGRARAQDSPFAAALPVITDGESFAITGENPAGEKGKGGQAASKLGATRKGRPAIPVPAGQRVTLADIRGAGVIHHIWITVPPPSKDFAPGPNRPSTHRASGPPWRRPLKWKAS